MDEETFARIVESFAEARRQGVNPDPEILAREHPTVADRLRDALAAVLAFENAGEASPPVLPDRIGGFRILREIGRGGMGVVYEAEQQSPRRRVALKVMSRTGPLQPALATRFQREAEIAGRLEHAGLCTVYAAGVEDGIPYIAMRFVEGESLATRLLEAGRRRERIPSEPRAGQDPPGAGTRTTTSDAASAPPASDVRASAALVEKIAGALHAAHEAGVIHRDLKPGNLMITPAGEPVVVDFGLATDLWSSAGGLTQTGAILGTPAYMAPEQVEGRVVDRRTDIHALGAILFESVTGRPAFERPTREALYRAIVNERPPPARRVNPAVPRDLALVIATCLEKDPEFRYQTALDLEEDLGRVRRKEPILARPVPLRARLARALRKHPARAALILALTVLAGTGCFLVSQWPRFKKGAAAEVQEKVDDLLEQSCVHFVHEDPGAAEAVLSEARGLAPDSLEVIAGLVRARVFGGDYDGALALLDQASAAGLPAALQHLRAAVFRHCGRSSDAGRIQDEIGEPRSAMEWYLAGIGEMLDCRMSPRSDFPAALRYLTLAVERSPRARPVYHFERAHAAMHARLAAEAIATAAAIAELWPLSDRAAYWRALALTGAGRSADVVAILREVSSRHPEDMAVGRVLGGELGRLRRFDEALAVLEPVSDRTPHDFNLALFVVRMLLDVGRREDALARLTDLLRTSEMDPADPESYVLGALLNWGHRDVLEEAVRRALACDPVPRAALWNAARLAKDSGQSELALDHVRAILASGPEARALGLLGILLTDLGRQEDAVAALEEAVLLQPGNPYLRSSLGSALLESGDRERARTMAATVVQSLPGWAGGFELLGRVAVAEERWADARRAFERQVRIAPEAFVGWHWLAFSALESEDPEAAEAASRRALEIEPQRYRTRCLRAKALRKLGRAAEALEVYEEAQAAAPVGSGLPFDRYLADTRDQADLEARLDGLVAGGVRELGHSEMIQVAESLAARKRFDAEARTWKVYLEAHAKPADAAGSDIRFRATRAAVRAALGEGPEAALLPPAARKAWFDQSREWFEADIKVLGGHLAGGRLQPARAAKSLERWRDERLLAPVRDAEGLLRLPPADAEAWRSLWTILDGLLEEACQ